MRFTCPSPGRRSVHALLPTDPANADGDGDTANWFTPEEQEIVACRPRATGSSLC
jgi:hypothetical protein